MPWHAHVLFVPLFTIHGALFFILQENRGHAVAKAVMKDAEEVVTNAYGGYVRFIADDDDSDNDIDRDNDNDHHSDQNGFGQKYHHGDDATGYRPEGARDGASGNGTARAPPGHGRVAV